ncbi:MAG: HAD family phosphatase [Propionibacteriaceae bacterium]|nr:HAD family phosphatase [Micropruina sp.]
MKSAVIFDMDGTLIDTEYVWDVVRRGLAKDHGIPWPEAATRAMMGMSTPEWSGYLVNVVGFPGPPSAAANEVIEGMLVHYRQGVEVLPGAVASVQRMADRGPIGLASSSPRRLIDAALDVMGITDLFSAIRSTEEGNGVGKPDPDAFFWVADALGVSPGRCVVIEDSTNGIQAGLNAGMPVIAIPPHFEPPAPALLAQCAAVIDTLDDLDGSLIDKVLQRQAE